MSETGSASSSSGGNKPPRKVLVAMDGSKYAIYAFECEWIFIRYVYCSSVCGLHPRVQLLVNGLNWFWLISYNCFTLVCNNT